VAAAPEVTEPHVLREYALVGDGERGAVVGPHGDIAWLCVPHWHDDPVFAALIGGTSHYTVRPDPPCVWGGAYEDDTMIWRSRWVTNDGFVTSRDALAYIRPICAAPCSCAPSRRPRRPRRSTSSCAPAPGSTMRR
jgi:alpha,alpha-trehalase